MENENLPSSPRVSYVLLALSFFVGFAGFIGYRYLNTPKTPNLPIEKTTTETPQPTLALMPPSQAISGVLTVLRGHTEMFTRTGDAYAEASTGAQVLLGESVATKENSQAKIEIPDALSATMGENAELVFANLFPENMVLQQKAGSVTYQLSDAVKPVAIRALHALISIRSGEASITVDDTDILVTVKTGSVKLALVDNDNNTNVWELEKGDRATIDDEARRVRILKSR